MRIKDICSGVTDGSHNPPQGLENSDYLMLSSKNVFDDKITFDSPRYLSQIDFEQESKRTRIKSGDVLLTIVGTVGRAAVVGENMPQFTLQRSVAVLHPNVEICDSRYLMYALQANRNHIESRAKGVAQKGIYLKEVADIELQIPLLSEQTHRVKVLDKIAFVIKFHQKQLQKLDELVKARFVEMFGELHYNRHGFKIVSVEEVCTMVKDGTHQTPQYTTDDIHGFKFLSSKDVMSQKVDWKNIKYISSELHEKLYSTLKPQRDDILMAKNGVNYGVAAVNDSDEVFDIYVSLALLRPKSIINPIYFRCVLNNPDTKEQFDSSIKGIGVPNLHLGEIKKTKILLPPIKLQNQFAAFVHQVDKSKVAVQKSLDEAQLLFDSLMQQYFG